MLTVLARILQKYQIEMGPGCNPKILEGGTLLIEGLELVFRPLHLMRIAHPATDMVLLTDEVLPLISFEEVQRHNEEGDVWMVIAGKVYDFTDFTKGKDGGHPGGKGVLLAWAGSDATAEWDFIGHSAFAQRIRDKYCIGTLDMSSEAARIRSALTKEKVKRAKVAVEGSTRKSVQSDTGGWAIATRVEQKRQSQLPVREPAVKEFTLEQVGKHNREDDCWIAIDGRVFNVTAFMLKHPGGKGSLMSVAGKDATAKFHGLHEAEILEQHAPELCVGVLRASRNATSLLLTAQSASSSKCKL